MSFHAKVIAAPMVLIALLLAGPAGAQQRPPMPEGKSAISGHVSAAHTGKPIRGAIVEIIVYENISSRFRQVTTDADGKFEFTKLPPGQYRLASQASGHVRMEFGQKEPGPPSLLSPSRMIQLTDGESLTSVDFALWPFSAIEGTVIDEFGDPAPNTVIQVSQLQFAGGRKRLMPVGSGPIRPTDDLGRFRFSGLAPGDYYVQAVSGTFADPNAAGGFAITFYPGTSKAAEAQVVTVPPGRDVPGVNFRLVPASMARVAGALVDGAGAPIRGEVMLVPSERTGAVLFVMSRTPADQSGRFVFRNVPPGSYTLQAFGAQPPGGPGNLGAAPFGYLPVDVAGQDLDKLIVTVPKPRTLQGRITFDGDMSRLPKPPEVFISARQVEFESAPIGGGPSPQTVRDDWTFEVNAMSGFRLVSAATRTGGWITHKVQLGGQDVTDTPLDLRESDVTGLEIVLTTRVTTVAGTVVGHDGKALPDITVVVFADDETKWGAWSRSVSFARTDAKGTFGVRGLPAGNYIAVPVRRMLPGEWQDPAFLKAHRVSADAMRFVLSDGGSSTISLTVRK